MSAAKDMSSSASRLRQVFEAHHAFVWRSARRLGVPMTDIDDVVQDTFIVAARRLAEFEGRSSIRTWLFSIASHVAHTYRRSETRRVRKAKAAAVSIACAVDPYARSEAAELLCRLSAELEEDHRTAWILHDLEGMTAPEIAEGLGLELNTVYSRVRSARKHVDAALQRLTAGEEDAR